MADFPSKVTTETGTPNSQNSQQQGGNSLRGLAGNVSAGMDMGFLRSIPSILMMVEMILGLLQWALIASSYSWLPAYGWVMFVAVTLWIITTILFFMFLFGAQRKISFVPWPLAMMVYHGVAAVLYLTAFLANAASVHPYYYSYFYGHMAAAAFFGAVVTVAYGASAFFSYMHWKGDGGNAATSTVPT